MSFSGRRVTADTGFGLVMTVAGAVMLAVLVRGAGEDTVYLSVVMGLVLFSGAAILLLDARQARRVSAAVAGLCLTDALGRQRAVPWPEVRRVRTLTERGFPGRDEHLDLVDGRLVALPAGLPDGSIQRWRRDLDPSEPQDDDPGSGAPVWRIPAKKMPSWVFLLQLPNLLFLASGPWAGYSLLLLGLFVLLLGVVLGVSYRQDRREVRADREGLSLPRFRGPRRISWADVRAVGGLSGRWDDEPRLELRDGSTVPLPVTVPAAVIARWRAELATPSSSREEHG